MTKRLHLRSFARAEMAKVVQFRRGQYCIAVSGLALRGGSDVLHVNGRVHLCLNAQVFAQDGHNGHGDSIEKPPAKSSRHAIVVPAEEEMKKEKGGSKVQTLLTTSVR